MTVAQDLQTFQDFNCDASIASFWVFKKRTASPNISPFTSVSVLISEELSAQLKLVVNGYRSTHTVTEEYALLSRTGEETFLTEHKEKTLFPSLQSLADKPAEENVVKKLKQLNNSAGYILRLRHGEDIVYCVKKSSADWAAKKKKGLLNVLFEEETLEIVDSPTFTIARSFDFFVIGETIFIANKPVFESLLNHRESYEEAYSQLKEEPGFAAAISNFSVFDTFIGNNATHLRRMSVIKARGYYKNPGYMLKLREINDLRSWGIEFDQQGRIAATPEKMRDILHILLDHRLRSELSDNQYDVPSATLVK